MTFLAFQTLWVPRASLQQSKPSLWGTTSQQDLEVAMKKVRFMNKDTLCCEAFFPWELCSPSNPAALPSFRCLSARSTDFLTSKHWGSKVSGFRLKTPAEDRMSLWPNQAWCSSPSKVLGQILLQRNNKRHLDCRIHLLWKERCCCFLPAVNWGVSGVRAFLCQLCCQHAPGVPPGQAALTHTGQAQSRYLGAQGGEGNLPG